MSARRDEPDQNKGKQRPQDQRATGPSGQSSATAAEARSAAAQQFLERRDVGSAKARPAAATRRLAPRAARTVVARRIAAIAAALAPRPFGVGEQAADAAAPPGNRHHRWRI